MRSVTSVALCILSFIGCVPEINKPEPSYVGSLYITNETDYVAEDMYVRWWDEEIDDIRKHFVGSLQVAESSNSFLVPLSDFVNTTRKFLFSLEFDFVGQHCYVNEDHYVVYDKEINKEFTIFPDTQGLCS